MNPEKLARRRLERMLQKNTVESLEKMAHCINCHKYAINAQEGKLNFLPMTNQVHLHHTVSQTDLIILTEKLALAKSLYEKTFFARMLSMHLIEMLDDMNTLIGRDMLREISFPFYSEFVPVFKALNKEYGKVKKMHGKFLREVRNKAAAHRTYNALYLAEITASLDHQKVLEIAMVVQEISRRVVDQGTLLVNRNIEVMETIQLMIRLLGEGKTKDEIKDLVPVSRLFGKQAA